MAAVTIISFEPSVYYVKRNAVRNIAVLARAAPLASKSLTRIATTPISTIAKAAPRSILLKAVRSVLRVYELAELNFLST